MRLGLPITISKWVESCNCNAPLDDCGYHLLTCKTGEALFGPMSLLLECGRSALEVYEFIIVVSLETGILTLNVDLTLSCLMLNRVLILTLTSRWHTLGAQMFSQALLRQQGLQLIEEKPERWPSTNNTNCLEAQ